MKIETAWVKPPPQIGGLDHLAVQAPCINIYGRLLPGITNVTDRARYYSFYPWLIWSFDQRGIAHYNDDFIERFRRADCLFSLIAERHASVTDGDHESHAGAMVGSNTLGPVAKECSSTDWITLSDYSRREGAQARYFKNKLGGLGQYYLGVLRELSILDGDTSTGIKYTRQIGQLIAERMDAGVDSKSFFAAVKNDSVTPKQLDALSAFCPCHLRTNPGEVEILNDLFFVRQSFYDVEALPRRRSLQSILQLAGLLRDQDKDLTEATFRGCAYAGALPSGEAWKCPESLTPNREKWALYARNELLSVAIQGLFYVLLDAYEESGLRFDSSSQVVDWFIHQAETQAALNQFGRKTIFTRLVEKSSAWLSPMSRWVESNHEVQSAERVVQLSRSRKQQRRVITSSLILSEFCSH